MTALPRTTIVGTATAILAVMLAAGGCRAPRQRDKDQQTGMREGHQAEAVVLTFDGLRLE